MAKFTKSAAAIANGMDAIDKLLAGAGLTKKADDSTHESNREDPNNMEPPRMEEFYKQREELKEADVPSSMANDGVAYDDGTPEDAVFQGAEVSEVDDEPNIEIRETPEETDAGTESPASVDVNNVEGKSASFNDVVKQQLSRYGAVKVAKDLSQYAIEGIDQLLAQAEGAKQATEAKQASEEDARQAAADDYVKFARENPERFLTEKVAAVRNDAYADADALFEFMKKKAEEEAAGAGDPEVAEVMSAIDNLSDEEAAALVSELEANGMLGGGEGELPAEDVQAVADIAEPNGEDAIAALSDATDAVGVSPEELPDLEAASMPAEADPETKAAAVMHMAEWASAVNAYRNAQRMGKVQTKKASVAQITLTNELTTRLRSMVAARDNRK